MMVNVDDLDEEYDPSSLPGSDAIIEPITASSGPPPPSITGLTSPTEGLGLSPGETTHALGDVTEEDEEEDSGSKPADQSPPSSLPSKYGSHLAAGQKGYVPRAHSPLAESTSADAAKTDLPALNLTSASLDSSAPPQPEEHTGGSSEIDFSEPDPNAEPIQGIRIMNAPMSLFPGSSRFTDSEFMISSPAQYTPPHTAADSTRPRSGSNSSSRAGVPNRLTAHQRTQSFGAFGIHARKRSGSNASMATLDKAGGAGSPHFPGSFAGLGGGPALAHHPSLLRNPRGPTGGRPAGIPIGAGMHYTPRPGGRFGLGGMPMSGSAVSLSEGA